MSVFVNYNALLQIAIAPRLCAVPDVPVRSLRFVQRRRAEAAHSHSAVLTVGRRSEICVVPTAAVLRVRYDCVVAKTLVAKVVLLKVASGLVKPIAIEEVVHFVARHEQLRDGYVDVRNRVDVASGAIRLWTPVQREAEVEVLRMRSVIELEGVATRRVVLRPNVVASSIGRIETAAKLSRPADVFLPVGVSSSSSPALLGRDRMPTGRRSNAIVRVDDEMALASGGIIDAPRVDEVCSRTQHKLSCAR